MSRGTAGERSRAALLACVLAAAAAAAVLAPSVAGGFVYDDHRFVAENAALREPSILWRAFADPSCQTSDGTHAGLWRPLRTLSFAFDASVLGGSPAAMHAVNVALHAAGTMLVAALLGAWGAGPPAAALGALVYGLHPAQAECVAWISSRGDLLAAGLVWAALLADLRGRAALSLGLGAAALLSKEQAAVWPLLVPVSRSLAGGAPSRWIDGLRAARAPLAAVAAFVAVRHAVHDAPGQEGGLGVAVGAREVAAALGHQTWFALTGSGSAFDWQMPPGTLPAAAAAAALLPMAALAFRTSRAPALWWLASLAPTLFLQILVPLNILVADRFVLFGLPAVAVLAARGADGSRMRTGWLAVVCAGLGAVTWSLVPAWRSDADLWGRVAAGDPSHGRANAWLGADALRRGDAEAALPRLRAATDGGARDGRTWLQRGAAEESVGLARGDAELVRSAVSSYAASVRAFAGPRSESPELSVLAEAARADMLLCLRDEAAAGAVDALVRRPPPPLRPDSAAALASRAERLSARLRSSGDAARAAAVRAWAGIR